MVITRQAPEQFQGTPSETLVDLEKLDGAELLDQFRKRQAKYATSPFDPDGHMLRFYPGGITIWSGYPGAGKTTVLRQMICHTLMRGSGVFLASHEEDPRDVIVRLTQTAAGTPDPSAHQVQWFIDAYAKRFRLWAKIGMAEHLQVLATARECAAQGIRHVFIDSLMCLDVHNGDWEGQRQFANLLSLTAKASGAHIHLVAHPRKPSKGDSDVDLSEVAGARELGGVADNVLFVRRDPNKQTYTQNADVTPMCISIRKQRYHNGALGEIEGWFQRNFRQFGKDQFAEFPRRYLPADAYEVAK